MAGDLTPPPGIEVIQPVLPLPTPTLNAIPEEAQSVKVDVQGQVLNGTIGGIIPAGMEVVLRAFDGNQRVFSQTTTIGEDGHYRFDQVEATAGRIFVVTGEHMGVVYASEPAHFAEEGSFELSLIVFDTTTEFSQIQVDRLHVILSEQTDGTLQVLELWIISNLGDRTVATNGGEGFLEVRLPASATDVQWESDAPSDRFQMTEAGFIDRLPIQPGSGNHEIVSQFELPFSKRLDFIQPMDLPVAALVLMVPEGGLRITGEGITDSGVRQIMGTSLHTYNADPISPGNALSFSVMRGGASQIASEVFSFLPGFLLGAIALLLALLVGSNWLRSAKALSANIPSADFVPSSGSRLWPIGTGELDAYLQAIADLDDAYDAGQIEQDAYREHRRKLKADIIGMVQGKHDPS
jgi:hypothetical protein